MAANNQPYRLLKPAQVAEKLEVSERTLERWRVQGVGPRHVKIEGNVRYRSDVVELYIEESERASTHG